MTYLKLTLMGIFNTLINLFDRDSALFKALLALIMFFAGIHNYVLVVGVLVFIDVITGVIAAFHRGELFSSRKLRKGLLEKLALYLVLMLSVFFTDHLLHSVIDFSAFYLTWFVSLLIALYELASIVENLLVIRPDLPFLSGLVKLLKKMGEKALKGAEKKVDAVIEEVAEVKIINTNKKEEGEPTDGQS